MVQFNKEKFLEYFDKALSVHEAFKMDASVIADVKKICSEVLDSGDRSFLEQLNDYAVRCSGLFSVLDDSADMSASADPREVILRDKYKGALFTFNAAIAQIVVDEKLSFTTEEVAAFNRRFLATVGLIRPDLH